MQTSTNDIFTIIELEHQENQITAALTINGDNDIFKGHFPNQPVVPGACMLQIIKEVLENALNYPLRLVKADHLKFVNMLVPTEETLLLDISCKKIENEAFKITGKLSSGEMVYFKFQGEFCKTIKSIL